jgi:hypothetical protein
LNERFAGEILPRELPKRDDRLLVVGKVQPDLYEKKAFGDDFPDVFSVWRADRSIHVTPDEDDQQFSPVIFINGSHVFRPRNRAELQIPVFRHRKPNTKEISE